MPRLDPRRIRHLSKNLQLLLPPNHGDLDSAAAELHWLSTPPPPPSLPSSPTPSLRSRSHARLGVAEIRNRCIARNKYIPLQYILHSQPFNDLDMLCRSGVLIPRWETEEWSRLLADDILRALQSEEVGISHQSYEDKEGEDKEEKGRSHGDEKGESVGEEKSEGRVKVLDLCTGTGCIAITLLNRLHSPTMDDRRQRQRQRQRQPRREVHVTGLDISTSAIRLARDNVLHNAHLLPPTSTTASTPPTSSITFTQCDILSPSVEKYLLDPELDVVTMNPPYIAREERHEISLSARRWEPRDALIPNGHRDVFYHRVIEILKRRQWECSGITGKKVKDVRVAFEVGSGEQGRAVSGLILRELGWSAEVWRDSAGRSRCVFASAMSKP